MMITDIVLPTPERRPAAILLPHHLKSGATSYLRIRRILDLCEPILSARGYIHWDVRGLLVNCDPTHKMHHGDGALRGQPRYHWEDVTNEYQLDILYGYPHPEG
jgi:hypothetical protein